MYESETTNAKFNVSTTKQEPKNTEYKETNSGKFIMWKKFLVHKAY